MDNNDEIKSLMTEYKETTNFLAEASQYCIDDMYWSVRDIEIKKDKLREMLSRKGINMNEADDLMKAAAKLRNYCDDRRIIYADNACNSCIFAVEHKHRHTCGISGFPDEWEIVNDEE